MKNLLHLAITRSVKGLILAALLILPLAIMGQHSKTTSKKSLQRAESTTAEPVPDFITTAADSGSVRFYGYEKTLRSAQETVFVSNLTPGNIYGLVFTVSYLDSEGRELHRRQVRTPDALPPGSTRRVDYPTWDKQHTFYFLGSPAPRVAAIPYRVKIQPDSIIVLKE